MPRSKPDPYRGTGRTTRLLKDALAEVAKSGFAIVLAWDHNHAMTLMQMTLHLISDPRPLVFWTRRGISWEGGARRLQFALASAARWDYTTCRVVNVPGFTATTPIFVDHYTYEQWNQDRRADMVPSKGGRPRKDVK